MMAKGFGAHAPESSHLRPNPESVTTPRTAWECVSSSGPQSSWGFSTRNSVWQEREHLPGSRRPHTDKNLNGHNFY